MRVDRHSVRSLFTGLGRIALACAAALGVATGVAYAVPAAISYEYFGLNFALSEATSHTVGVLDYTGGDGCGGTCTATTALGHDPSETIDVDQVVYDGTGGGYSMAELGYYFEVPGSGTTMVHIHAGDSLHATANGYAQAYLAVGPANIYYTSFNNFLSYTYQDTDCLEYCDEGVGGAPRPLPSNQALVVTRGQYYLVEEWIQVGAATSGVQLTDSADPTITTSPGDTILFSPGVLSAVPEPAAWTLMIVGFTGLGAAARTRRRLKLMA